MARLEQVVGEVEKWLERVVVGLNLCPFASRPYRDGRVRIAVSESSDFEEMLGELYREMSLLGDKPVERVETTLLVCSEGLADFDDYLDCLGVAEGLLDSSPWRDEIQIASFHPHYCFADAEPDDSANFSNRAPYPIFHLLREQSLAEAIEAFGDTATIPERNITLLREMSEQQLRSLFPYAEPGGVG